MCDFTGEAFKGFEVLYFSMSATTTQLLSSGEFCKLRYDTTPVKSASANVSLYTNNSKMTNFLVVTFLSQMSCVSDENTKDTTIRLYSTLCSFLKHALG